MNKKPLLRGILIFIVSGLLFFLCTMPFRKILSVFTISEVRPAAVLNPLLGICFGLPASLGIAVANFIADWQSGYPAAILFEGLIPQFLYCYIPFLMWNALTKTEDHAHRLDSSSRVLKYALCVTVYAILSGIGVAVIVVANFGGSFLKTAFFVFLNNFIMGIVLGCPLMILINFIMRRPGKTAEERRLARSERIILYTALAELAAVIIIILCVYLFGKSNGGVYDVWNTVFVISAIAVIVIMIVSLAVILGGKKNTQSERN